VSGVERLPESGPAVLVSNHVSWLDPIVLPLVLPRKPAFLAMEELWLMPGLRMVMRLYGPKAIPLRRGAIDTAALKRALEILKNGALLIVFPEGGISHDGRLQPFHRGAALLAARADTPLIPVAIKGTAEALPLGQILPQAKPITVSIGTPIRPHGTSREALRRAGEEAASQIQALLSPP
jgi:1-acyl-sn-glycerol-3-phosphate acyltransferase